LRISPASPKELPSFQVELTEELAGSMTAGGRLAPGRRHAYGGNADCVGTALTGCCVRLAGTYMVSAAADD
jgi:hypothetical protein